MRRFIIIYLLLIQGLAWAQDAPPTAQIAELEANTQKTLEDEVALRLAAWQERLDAGIAIIDIKALDIREDDSNALLKHRRKSLLLKKKSNREWLDFWKEEQRSADELIALIDAFTAKTGDHSYTAHIQTLEEEVEEAAFDLEDVATALARIDADTAAVRERVEAGRAGVQTGLDAATTLADQRRTAAVVAARALRDAQQTTPPDSSAIEAAQTTKDQAAVARATANSKRAQLVALWAAIDVGLKGGAFTDDLPDHPLTADVTALLNAQRQRAELKAKAEKARAIRAALPRRIKAVHETVARWRARRVALAAWSALARDKQANQDRYFAALSEEVSAIERRLDQFQKPTRKHIGRSRQVCENPPNAKETTAWTQHRACLTAIRAEARELKALRDDGVATLNLILVKTGAMESEVETPMKRLGLAVVHPEDQGIIKKLMQAQRVDRTLAIREDQITSDELRRLSRPKRPETWDAIWTTLGDRAGKKVGTLTKALAGTRQTQRALKVDAEVAVAEVRTYTRRLDALAAYEVEQGAAGRWASAILKSAWQFLQRGYLIPIYLFLAWLLIVVGKRAGKRLMKRSQRGAEGTDRAQRVETLTAVTLAIFRLIVYVVVLLMCLTALGVDVGPLLGGAAIFGLAISFGSQSLVKDVVTGFFILLENQYAVGDKITTGGHVGHVEALTLRRTVLRDLDGRVHNIPNGSISVVSNLSQGWARGVLHLGVGYDDDLDLVREVVDRTGDAMFADPDWAEKLSDAPRYIGVTSFDADAVTFRVTFKTKIFQNDGAVREFNYRIKKAFDAAGISIPYAQRDVHVVSRPEDGPKPVTPSDGSPRVPHDDGSGRYADARAGDDDSDD